MYKAGDYVAVAGYGICRVVSVGFLTLSGADPSKKYYTLCSEHEGSLLYIPCEISAERMRPVISKENAVSLIKNIPLMKYDFGRDKQRILRYRQALQDGRPEVLLPVIRELYEKWHDPFKKKSSGSMTENSIFREAEEMLNAEFAVALGCDSSEVPSLIERIVDIKQ